jgi:hypothetical protein
MQSDSKHNRPKVTVGRTPLTRGGVNSNLIFLTLITLISPSLS